MSSSPAGLPGFLHVLFLQKRKKIAVGFPLGLLGFQDSREDSLSSSLSLQDSLYRQDSKSLLGNQPTGQEIPTPYTIQQYVSIQLVLYLQQPPGRYLHTASTTGIPSTCHKNPSATPKIIKTRRPHSNRPVGESYSQKKSDKEMA